MSNPKQVTQAMTRGGAGKQVGDLTLRPFTLWTFLALEEMESPLAEGGRPKMRDVALATYLLSQPEEESVELLEEGPAKLMRAVRDFSRSIPSEQFADLGAAITELYNRAQSTVAPAGLSEEGEKKTESPARKTKAGAGGS